MKIPEKLKLFWEEESGQTSAEYVLILAVILTLVMQMRGKLIGMLKRIFEKLDDKTEILLED